MPVIAAIDVGSNAIRLAIAMLTPDGHHEVSHNAREALRLGQDVFATGSISPASMERAVEAFGRFREQIERHAVASVKTASTSAVREAANRDSFVTDFMMAIRREHRDSQSNGVTSNVYCSNDWHRQGNR